MIEAAPCFAAPREEETVAPQPGRNPLPQGELQNLLQQFRESHDSADLAACTKILREMQERCRLEPKGLVEKAKAKLLEALEPGHLMQSEAAMDALSELRDDPEVQAAAVRALDDPRLIVTTGVECARILGGSEDPEIRARLLLYIHSDSAGLACARALSPVSKSAELQKLLWKATSGDFKERVSEVIDCVDVASSLGKASLNDLLKNLSVDLNVRAACAEKLGKEIDPKDAKRMLKEECKDKWAEPAFKKALAKSLMAADPERAKKTVLWEARCEDRWYGAVLPRNAPWELVAALESLGPEVDCRSVREALAILMAKSALSVASSQAIRTALAQSERKDVTSSFFAALPDDESHWLSFNGHRQKI